MKNKLLILMFMTLLTCLLFVGADWTPQGNINLRNIYNITGVPYVNATVYYGNGSKLTGVTVTQTNSTVWWNNVNGWVNTWFKKTGSNLDFNETKLNNTIHTIDTATNISMRNYVNSVNNSQSVWTDNFFVRFTELVNQIGNWTSDKPNYYLKSNPYVFYNSTTLNNNNQLTNGAGYISSYTETDPLWSGNKTDVAFKNIANSFTADQKITGDLNISGQITGDSLLMSGPSTPTLSSIVTNVNSYAGFGASNSLTKDVGLAFISYGSSYIGTAFGLNKANLSRIYSYGSRSEERRVGKECRSRWSPYH